MAFGESRRGIVKVFQSISEVLNLKSQLQLRIWIPRTTTTDWKDLIFINIQVFDGGRDEDSVCMGASQTKEGLTLRQRREVQGWVVRVRHKYQIQAEHDAENSSCSNLSSQHNPDGCPE